MQCQEVKTKNKDTVLQSNVWHSLFLLYVQDEGYRNILKLSSRALASTLYEDF